MKGGRLLDGNIDLSTEELGRVACAMLGIPVYSSLKESLHLLFTLYLDAHQSRERPHLH
jgi:hypothetical protein